MERAKYFPPFCTPVSAVKTIFSHSYITHTELASEDGGEKVAKKLANTSAEKSRLWRTREIAGAQRRRGFFKSPFDCSSSSGAKVDRMRG